MEGKDGSRSVRLLVTLHCTEEAESSGAQVCPSAVTSFSKAPPPKGSTTLQKATPTKDHLLKHMSLLGTWHAQIWTSIPCHLRTGSELWWGFYRVGQGRISNLSERLLSQGVVLTLSATLLLMLLIEKQSRGYHSVVGQLPSFQVALGSILSTGKSSQSLVS